MEDLAAFAAASFTATAGLPVSYRMTPQEYAMVERLHAETRVVFDIETYAIPSRVMGRRAWDVRYMLDPNEHPQEARDQFALALIYAEQTGLIVRDGRLPHIVYIARDPA